MVPELKVTTGTLNVVILMNIGTFVTLEKLSEP
jgi:hypothetical protein